MSAIHAPSHHALASHAHVAGGRCPWCDQVIPNEKLAEITGRIEAREREQMSALTARLKEQHLRERQAVEAKAKADIEAVRIEAKALADAAAGERLAALDRARLAAEAQVVALKTAQEAALAAREAELRLAMEAEKVSAIQAEQAKVFEDKQKLQGKIAELQRQLENKTAQDLGDSAEVNLFEDLKKEFPEDRISRVEKGAAGADIVHDVHYNGRLVGRIVYDAKNRSAWRNDYVTKLRQDQADAKADHAVLASKVFPGGIRELHLQDNVIVISSARVIVLSTMLRRHLIQTHALRLSNEAKSQKTEALYAFIMSERCTHLLASIETHADDMSELDRQEEKAHAKTWKRRAELIRNVQRSHGDLTSEIERIIGTRDA